MFVSLKYQYDKVSCKGVVFCCPVCSICLVDTSHGLEFEAEVNMRKCKRTNLRTCAEALLVYNNRCLFMCLCSVVKNVNLTNFPCFTLHCQPVLWTGIIFNMTAVTFSVYMHNVLCTYLHNQTGWLCGSVLTLDLEDLWFKF